MVFTLPILTFWFGEPDSPHYAEPRQFWFQSTPALDEEIRSKFEVMYKRAAQGHMDSLAGNTEGCLALIILLDQVPRNMYRGSPQAFATDSKALKIAKEMLTNKFDRNLLLNQKMFAYLPFEHSENIKDQNKSVELFQSLGDEQALKYALAHRDLIARFGRFPYRNHILGRKNTPEEEAFLDHQKKNYYG